MLSCIFLMIIYKSPKQLLLGDVQNENASKSKISAAPEHVHVEPTRRDGLEINGKKIAI